MADTISIGDTLKMGSKTIKIHLPILRHGYTWCLSSPDKISCGDLTNTSQRVGYYMGSYGDFEECRQNAISALRHYLQIIENYKQEDVDNVNIGRPNFKPEEK